MTKFPWEYIQKKKWQYLVNRNGTHLCQSIIDSAFLGDPKATGLNWVNDITLRPGNDELLLPEADIAGLIQQMQQMSVKDILGFRNRLIKHLLLMDKFSVELDGTDFSKLSQSVLRQKLEKFCFLSRNACAFLDPLPILDRHLSKQILEFLPGTESQKQARLATLTYPTKDSNHTLEEKSFYNLIKSKKSPRFQRLLKQHLKEYAWIGGRSYWWERAWTEDTIRDRMANFSEMKKNAAQELHHLNSIQHKHQKDFNKCIQKLKISKNSEQYKLIAIAREFAFLRTWRTDLIYRAGYRARNLFYEVTKRAQFPRNMVPWSSIYEVLEMAKIQKLKLPLAEVSKRKIGFVALTWRKKYFVVTGTNNVRRAVKLAGREYRGQVTEVKGNSAFPGKIRGRVRVILSGLELKDFKRGEVLVSVMTFPNFVPAMEKAVAFVTDEGGILCHAAIVSREMKKPCVIATKSATKIFKDGDMVEVDANKGIVRKI